MIRTYFLNSQKLPLVVEPETFNKSAYLLNELARSHRDFFRERLLRYGALLFRGFEVTEAAEFEDFVRRFSGKELLDYAGGVSPRRSLNKGVYTSTEYPPQLALGLHNELSYSKVYPRQLYFFSHTAPSNSGETTLGDSRKILQNIRSKIVGLFKHKQIRYDRILHPDKGSGYSWQDAFETGDKTEVEKICGRAGADFCWQKNDILRISQTRPATACHPETGEEVWFNQADGFHPSNLDAETQKTLDESGERPRLNCFFGDDSYICGLMLEHVRGVLQNETVLHRWQTGDILIVDNLLTAHGRMPFSGARKILLAMT